MYTHKAGNTDAKPTLCQHLPQIPWLATGLAVLVLHGCGVNDDMVAPKQASPPDDPTTDQGVDLVFEALSQYSPFYTNEAAKILISVRNDGEEPSGQFSIYTGGLAAATATYNDAGHVIEIRNEWSWQRRVDIDDLPAGETRDVPVTFPLTNDQTHTVATVEVFIDSQHAVNERNEANNTNITACPLRGDITDCSKTGKPFGNHYLILTKPASDN